MAHEEVRSAQATFILKSATNPKAKRLLNAVAPGDPSPKCAACGTARLELHINTAATTLAQLLDKARAHAHVSTGALACSVHKPGSGSGACAGVATTSGVT